MSEEIRIWTIGDEDTLVSVERAKLSLENRIENWLVQDISVLDVGLLVIGRQVPTEFGGWIDLLCLDSHANVVIVELKRDRTPREVTAQVLDYGSWVKNLSKEKIARIAAEYLKRPLEEVYSERFNSELPDIVNERHSMRVVGSEIDASSERIIKYLSDSYGVDINAATFSYYHGTGGQEFLARTFLVEPSEVQYRADEKSLRGANSSVEQLQAEADRKGLGAIFRLLRDGLDRWFSPAPRRNSLTFAASMPDGSHKAVMGLWLDRSTTQDSLTFTVFLTRLAIFSELSEQELLNILPARREPYQYYQGAPLELTGWTCFFTNEGEARQFIEGLSRNLH